MTTTHRLSIYLNEKLVGNLDCQNHQGEVLIKKLQNLLSADEGWTSVRWVSDEEKRILESSPAGIRLISSEKLFRRI